MVTAPRPPRFVRRLAVLALAGLLLGTAAMPAAAGMVEEGGGAPPGAGGEGSGEGGKGGGEKGNERGGAENGAREGGEEAGASSKTKPARPVRISRVRADTKLAERSLTPAFEAIERASRERAAAEMRVVDIDSLRRDFIARRTRLADAEAIARVEAPAPPSNRAAPDLATRYRAFGDARGRIDAARRTLLRIGTTLEAANTAFDQRRAASDNPNGAEIVALGQALTSAIAENDDAKAALENRSVALLRSAAATIFGDSLRAETVTLTGLGAGGNSEVFSGQPQGSDRTFAYKFETRFDYAPDADVVGLPPENIGGAARARASWIVAVRLGDPSLLVEAVPVLLNGLPAQRMDLLDSALYHPAFTDARRRQLAGDEAAAALAEFDRRAAEILRTEISASSAGSPYQLAEAALDLRGNQARLRVTGNPRAVSAVDPASVVIDPRLSGAQSTNGLGDPVLQRRLCLLEYVDLITGQIDRNDSNFLIRYRPGPDGSRMVVADLRGIDNNLAFGSSPDTVNTADRGRAIGKLPRMPKKVDLELAATILGRDADQFITSLGPEVAELLTAAELAALRERYDRVRDHVVSLVRSGDIVMRSGLPEREEAAAMAALKRVNPRLGVIEPWGLNPSWQAYFWERRTIISDDDDEVEVPGSQDGSYLSRLAAAPSQ